MVRLQTLGDENKRVTNLEGLIIGEQGARACAKVIEYPLDMSFEDQRVVEAIIWPNFENWEHMFKLHEQGLLGDEWKDRVTEEVPFDHEYGRAWWRNFNDFAVVGEIPGELKVLIDELLGDSPDFHVQYHKGVMQHIRANRDH
jgi:hypothetical protein